VGDQFTVGSRKELHELLPGNSDPVMIPCRLFIIITDIFERESCKYERREKLQLIILLKQSYSSSVNIFKIYDVHRMFHSERGSLIRIFHQKVFKVKAQLYMLIMLAKAVDHISKLRKPLSTIIPMFADGISCSEAWDEATRYIGMGWIGGMSINEDVTGVNKAPSLRFALLHSIDYKGDGANTTTTISICEGHGKDNPDLAEKIRDPKCFLENEDRIAIYDEPGDKKAKTISIDNPKPDMSLVLGVWDLTQRDLTILLNSNGLQNKIDIDRKYCTCRNVYHIHDSS
jgi:hypothetical protein